MYSEKRRKGCRGGQGEGLMAEREMDTTYTHVAHTYMHTRAHVYKCTHMHNTHSHILTHRVQFYMLHNDCFRGMICRLCLFLFSLFKNKFVGAGKMAQQLRT